MGDKLIFVNLPVADLARSTVFYDSFGARKNAQFSMRLGPAWCSPTWVTPCS